MYSMKLITQSKPNDENSLISEKQNSDWLIEIESTQKHILKQDSVEDHFYFLHFYNVASFCSGSFILSPNP